MKFSLFTTWQFLRHCQHVYYWLNVWCVKSLKSFQIIDFEYSKTKKDAILVLFVGLFVSVLLGALGPHLVELKVYSWLCAQKLLLRGSGEHMGCCCGSNEGLPLARQMSYTLCYHSSSCFVLLRWLHWVEDAGALINNV